MLHIYIRFARNLSILRSTFSNYSFYDLVLVGSSGKNLEKLPSSLKNSVDAEPKLKSSLQQDGEKGLDNLTAEDRIKKVFGGRIKGEDRISSSRILMGEPRTIAGVKVPDKPQEPDNCCMSGCINCVWEIYNDDIKDWEAKRTLAARKLVEKGGVWPADFYPPVKLLKPENLPDSFKGQSVENKELENGAWNRVPVEMRVFAELEKKIKGRKEASALA